MQEQAAVTSKGAGGAFAVEKGVFSTRYTWTLHWGELINKP